MPAQSSTWRPDYLVWALFSVLSFRAEEEEGGTGTERAQRNLTSPDPPSLGTKKSLFPQCLETPAIATVHDPFLICWEVGFGCRLSLNRQLQVIDNSQILLPTNLENLKLCSLWLFLKRAMSTQARFPCVFCLGRCTPLTRPRQQGPHWDHHVTKPVYALLV